MFHILIVDDTKAVHTFVKSLLGQSKEITTTSVYNGKEAIDLLKTNLKVDLVLLDWEMPIMNGPETFQKMKNLCIKTPTMMITTKNSAEDIEKMVSMGVAEYLMKPFTVDILMEKIKFATGKEIPYAS